jgi:hypothetical protein
VQLGELYRKSLAKKSPLIDRDFEEIQDFVENAQLFKEGRAWQNWDVGNEWTSFNFPKLGQKPFA